MNYSNPLQALMQMGQSQQNPLQALMQMGQRGNQISMPFFPAQNAQPINHQQFIQGTANLNKDALAGLVNQARQSGIAEEDIKNGLDFLLQLRK